MLVWSSFNILNPENKSISNNILEALAFCKQCSGKKYDQEPEGDLKLKNKINYYNF